MAGPTRAADPATPHLSIGDLAMAVGVNVRTIRYYETAGLLPAPARTAGNQRRYGVAHLRRLAFVRHAREMGFDMEAIRDLLRLSEAGAESPCAGAHGIARRQLAATRSRIARLRSLEAELERMLGAECDGRLGHCRVVEVLADHAHGHCLDPTHGGAEERAA